MGDDKPSGIGRRPRPSSVRARQVADIDGVAGAFASAAGRIGVEDLSQNGVGM